MMRRIVGLALAIASLSAWPLSAPRAQDADLQFTNLSIAQGLSQSIINDMLQDRQGFLWFVTEDGLNRYDGYRFVVFKHDARDPFSLIHNEIKCVLEDRDGILWVGSFNRALERFDPATQRFAHFRHDAADPTTLGNNIVWALLEDREGRLWVGTGEGGLDQMDRAAGRFTHYRHDPRDPGSLAADDVRCLLEDTDGALWAGTRGGGLGRLDPVSGRFTVYRHDPRDPHSLGNDIVLALRLDAEGTLWVGTDGGGLNRFDRATGTFTRYVHDPDRPASLAGDRVYSLLIDRSGLLWVGTYGTGISRCDLRHKRFLHYRNEPEHPATLSSNIVWSFCEDGDALWIATNDGGLNRYDRASGLFTALRHDPADPRSPASNSIRMVIRDRTGKLWLATNDAGLDTFDPRTNAWAHHRHDPATPGSLAGDVLRFVYEDRAGTIWAGTYGTGLDRWDPRSRAFAHYRNDPADPSTISSDYVRAVYEDAAGTLWFGTHGGGLDRFDRTTGKFNAYRNDPATAGTLSNDFVFCLHEDRAGTLWIATYGGGLNRFDRQAGTFTALRRSDGLPDDAVYGILEDGEGNLWLSTNSGIARYDPHAGAIKTYTIADGLQSNEFNGGSFYRDSRGHMYFGGINGYNEFVPEEIVDSPFQPPIVFTDFQLSNRSVPIGPLPSGCTLLETSIARTDRIELSYEDRVVSFEFAALDYASPENNRYSYRLAKLQKEWIDLGTRHFIMFTTLPPGHYTLQVRGTNRDGVWNERGTSLALIVDPPWWRAAWAYGVYSLLVIALAVLIARVGKARERARGRIVEAELRAQAAELQNRTTEAEARALKTENERQTHELESARRLQLSMLPRTLPEHGRYAIAARMRTATEVGGDYYDFRLDDDGTLTVAIGDAIGHGMRAGIMVAVMKGMLTRMPVHADLPDYLGECRRSLCKFGIDQMMMALGLLRLSDHEAAFTAAALSPIFVYRAATGQVEAITVPGMMLGAEFDIPYEQARFPVHAGDRILLVTDGILEQPNAADDHFDAERCAACFREVGAREPEAIIDHLLLRLDSWRDTIAQRDDVTLVVLGARE